MLIRAQFTITCHEVAIINNRKRVVIPGKKIWKVQRGRAQRLSTNQTLDSGDQNFTPNQIAEKAEEMQALMNRFMPVATGATGHGKTAIGL